MLFFLDKDKRTGSRVAGDDEGVAEGTLQAQPSELGQNNSFHLRFTPIFVSILVTDPGPMLREGCGKSKWKFKMAFAMKGVGVSRGSRVPHTYFEK